MKKKGCPECGGNMTQKNPSITVRVADKRVKDGSMSLPTCDKCGYYELSQAELEKMERRAAITVLNGVDGPSGGVLKFARKALGLRQADLARALGTASETVSRWEANERIDRTVSLAVAHLLGMKEQEPEQLDLLVQSDGDEPSVHPPPAARRQKRTATG